MKREKRSALCKKEKSTGIIASYKQSPKMRLEKTETPPPGIEANVERKEKKNGKGLSGQIRKIGERPTSVTDL